MANDWARFSVVTAISYQRRPLAECIEEIRKLSGSLGIYGCNVIMRFTRRRKTKRGAVVRASGNETIASENAPISFRGAQLNLIGVDYQRERGPGGKRIQTLAGAEKLVRRYPEHFVVPQSEFVRSRAQLVLSFRWPGIRMVGKCRSRFWITG